VSNYYASLASRGALCISGPGALAFLQGQSTCDTRDLPASRSLAGACCNPQGRMYCDFRLLNCAEDSWLMLMDAGICDSTLATLGKYIVFAKATIENVTGQWRRYAVWGPDANKLIGAGEIRENRSWSSDGILWVQVDAGGERYECCATATQSQLLEERLAKDFIEASANDYNLQEIEAGIAHIATQTVGEFLPQMLNYQLTGRVSFSKGCYTGQEVVARMHYRGKLKKPMYLAHVDTIALPQPGTPLYAGEGEQSIGTVINAALRGEGVSLLATINTRALDGAVTLGAPDGPTLQIRSLPYSLD
jgi:folate-binding protein YgfZ